MSWLLRAVIQEQLEISDTVVRQLSGLKYLIHILLSAESVMGQRITYHEQTGEIGRFKKWQREDIFYSEIQ